MLTEQLKVKVGILGEGIVDIAVEVHSDEAATVIRAQRNLTAGVCRDGAEAQVGIAVGHRLAGDSVPEKHAWLGALPCVVHDFVPQLLGIDFLLIDRVVAVDRVLLRVLGSINGGLHECVINAHTDIGSGDLPFYHLGVDKRLAVGVLDADGEHQGASTAVLCHLAG